MVSAWSYFLTASADLYAFAVPENAAVGTTVGRIMAEDGDIGINAKMTYSLEDDLETSATFIIRTDPVTQEGVVLLAKVHARLFIFCIWLYFHLIWRQIYQRRQQSKEAYVGGQRGH